MRQLKQNLQVKLFYIKGHNLQTSNCSQNTVQKQEVLLARRGMMGNPLLLCSAKPARLYSHGGTMCWPFPALHSSLPWCTCVCVGVSGLILHKVTKAWCSNSTCGIEPTSDLGWRWCSDLVLFTAICLQGDCFQLARIALFYCAHEAWYFLKEWWL